MRKIALSKTSAVAKAARDPNRGLHGRYPRIYAALKQQGHDAAKAIEILLDATRGDKHALMWCRMIAKLGRH